MARILKPGCIPRNYHHERKSMSRELKTELIQLHWALINASISHLKNAKLPVQDSSEKNDRNCPLPFDFIKFAGEVFRGKFFNLGVFFWIFKNSEKKKPSKHTSWWLNQPIWKVLVKLDHHPQVSVKIENIYENIWWPPPRDLHQHLPKVWFLFEP